MGRFSTWLLSSTLLSTGGAVASYAEEAETLTQPDHEVILVSGRRIDQTLDDVAGSISVVTQEDIERQLVTNMSELFDRDPSVDVTGDVGDAQNFRVRGMGGDRVLMIKDGRVHASGAFDTLIKENEEFRRVIGSA